MSCIMEHPYILAVVEYGKASAICKTCCCEAGEREFCCLARTIRTTLSAFPVYCVTVPCGTLKTNKQTNKLAHK